MYFPWLPRHKEVSLIFVHRYHVLMDTFHGDCCTRIYSSDAISNSRLHHPKIFRHQCIEKNRMKFAILKKPPPTLLRSIKCRAEPSKKFEYIDTFQILRQAIIEANRLCTSEIYVDEFECMAAWDTVDEIARGIAIRNSRDPLEDFCVQNQDADECKVFDI